SQGLGWWRVEGSRLQSELKVCKEQMGGCIGSSTVEGDPSQPKERVLRKCSVQEHNVRTCFTDRKSFQYGYLLTELVLWREILLVAGAGLGIVVPFASLCLLTYGISTFPSCSGQQVKLGGT